MITILTTTDECKKINEYITSIDRLDELVSVSEAAHNEFPVRLKIAENQIQSLMDWQDTIPPYVFPCVALTRENLLALVFFHLGNHQRAFEFLEEKQSLYVHLLIATSLQFGYVVSDEAVSAVQDSANYCFVNHYGNTETQMNYETLCKAYEEAIQQGEKSLVRTPTMSTEVSAFLSKHYGNLLLDANDFKKAEQHLRSQLRKDLPEPAQIALKSQLASALVGRLQFPYQETELNTIAELQNECLAYFEAQNEPVKEGLLSLEAAEIAGFKADFIQAKELLNKAILNFKKEDIPELLGEASLRKAALLYNWSKNGSPQYYKPAINAYQDTLKVFKRHSHPEKFAEIHHNLALIYSEIPAAAHEKAIWTAFCASSFKEALSVYQKETHPYQFAMTCHNYATALMNFPEAKLHSNLDKAYGLFEDALQIRTAKDYPFERALTLTNQLELLWLKHNETAQEEEENHELMLQKAHEIKTLVDDPRLIKKADEQIVALEKLKPILT
ncbi:MAG: hypothetical protein AAF740_00280 [Bacteroidota bacterium]